jgi:hypothetical protein
MCGKGAIAGRSSPTRGAHGEPTRQRAAVESVPAAAAASLGAIGTAGRSLEWPASTLSRNTQRRLAAAVWEIQPVPFPRTGRAVTPCRGRKHPRASMPLGSRKNWRPGGATCSCEGNGIGCNSGGQRLFMQPKGRLLSRPMLRVLEGPASVAGWAGVEASLPTGCYDHGLKEVR